MNVCEEINLFNKLITEAKERYERKEMIDEEMHKCIGCPCLENDYPSCERCSFQESCLSGNSPYPNKCNEGDCFYTFNFLATNKEKIEELIRL